MIDAFTISDEHIIEVFKHHCECRPVQISRESHSHDCDTRFTDVCRTAVTAPGFSNRQMEARAQCADWFNNLKAGNQTKACACDPVRNYACIRCRNAAYEDLFKSEV